MNRLIFINLLILLILCIGCQTDCPAKNGDGGCDTPTTDFEGYTCVLEDDSCKKYSICEKASSDCEHQDVPQGYKCEGEDGNCQLVSLPTTKPTTATTNSSNALNIFKISFGLLIIFSIL